MEIHFHRDSYLQHRVNSGGIVNIALHPWNKWLNYSLPLLETISRIEMHFSQLDHMNKDKVHRFCLHYLC